MGRKSIVLKSAAATGALALILAGCGGEGDIPDPPDVGDNGGGDSQDGAPVDDAFPIMMDWSGCEALNDVTLLQDYLGVEVVAGDGLIDAAIGEGIDGEAMSCSGNFELATFEFSQGSTQYSEPGLAEVQVGVVPWENVDIAAENYQERLQRLEDGKASGGTDYTDEQSGELGGEWDESYWESGNTGTAYEISTFGRDGQWILYALVHVTHDPGRAAYEVEPDFYPDQTADDLAVYPFTMDELIDWMANDFMTQTQSEIVEKIESEK